MTYNQYQKCTKCGKLDTCYSTSNFNDEMLCSGCFDEHSTRKKAMWNKFYNR